MELHGLLFRVHYLVTRGISRPQRAFSTVANHRPILDVCTVVLVGICWLLVMELVAGLRTMVQNHGDATLLLPGLLEMFGRYAFAMAVAVVWGLGAAFIALMLGGKPRLLATLLANALAVSIAYGVMAFPIAVVRLVDQGDLSSASASVVEVAPWIYLIVLLYAAQIKIHKTVPNRAVVYLALGAMPLFLAWSVLRWWFPGLLPAFIRW